MRFEARVVELLDGVLHVLAPRVLDGARAVLEDVGEADVARLAHVVLQVLPAASRRQPGDDAPEARPAGWRAPSPAALPVRGGAGGAPEPSAPGKLHAQLVTVVVVPVAGVHGVFSIPEQTLVGDKELFKRKRHANTIILTITVLSKFRSRHFSPGILEFDKGKRRSPAILEVDEYDLAVLVEEVLDILGSDVGRKVAHVDPRLVLSNPFGSHYDFSESDILI